MTTEPLWQPDDNQIAQSRVTDFMRWLENERGVAVEDFKELRDWSLTDTAGFWDSIWDFCNVIGDKGNGPVIENPDQIPGARFFPNAKINFAENLLSKPTDEPALIFRGEDVFEKTIAHADLKADVSCLAQGLDALDLKPGERVAAVVPNMPETIAAFAATAARGGVWSSCSPDFGEKGILDRFGQIEPSVLFACDGYYYNGKTIHIGDKLKAVAAKLPSVRRIVVIDYIGEADAIARDLDSAVTYDVFMTDQVPAEIDYVRLPFNHPLYILFSSGTTGVPKCIVHSAGGILLKHLSEHQLHVGVQPGDRLFYFSTCGWMMWNWLVTGLASGATLMLFDGSPFYPNERVLFDFAQDYGMNIFGTSAKYIDAVKKTGWRPADDYGLESVRAMLSTGSPLVPESFDFVYQDIKKDIHLASVSGGTDLCGCFVAANPIGPVWRGEIQTPGVGMDVAVYDDDGQAMRSGKGELVCRNAFPSMPIGFWNDDSGEKYRSAYFERFDNTWCHGDFAEFTEHGGMIIHGRSDATLNPGGVRIGTAEIYRQVEQIDEVVEGLAIGQDFDNDTRVVLFVILRDGMVLDEELEKRIRLKIRTGASPRHVPARIVDVADIPRTKSGKITELAVRDIVHGRKVKNKEALANPKALDLFKDLEKLKT